MILTTIFITIFVSPFIQWKAGIAPSYVDSVSAPRFLPNELIQDTESSYFAALKEPDPTRRASALDAFAARYPDSPLKIDALEQEIVAYRQKDLLAKEVDAANRLLEAKHSDTLALATIVRWKRFAGGSVDGTEELRKLAENGLKAFDRWTPPKGMSDTAFQSLRTEIAAILHGGAGYAALEMKEFAAARIYYRKAIQWAAHDFINLYQLGTADLEMSPPDMEGFWYVAKAANMAPSYWAKDGMLDYGRKKYRLYLGTEAGWDSIVSSVAGQDAPPPDFASKLPQ
jgi:tetratricopeptide (TPR) repeat protein